MTIRERREAVDISREALANEAGCSVAYVSFLERGYSPGRSRVLPLIEQALDRLEARRLGPATPAPPERVPDFGELLDRVNFWTTRAHDAEQARDRLAHWIRHHHQGEGIEVDAYTGLVIS